MGYLCGFRMSSMRSRPTMLSLLRSSTSVSGSSLLVEIRSILIWHRRLDFITKAALDTQKSSQTASRKLANSLKLPMLHTRSKLLKIQAIWSRNRLRRRLMMPSSSVLPCMWPVIWLTPLLMKQITMWSIWSKRPFARLCIARLSNLTQLRSSSSNFL